MRIERRRPSLGECFANHTHTHYGPPDEIENVPRRGREQHIRVAFEVLRGLNSSGTAVHLIGMSLRPARAIKLSHFRDALHVNVMVEFISRLFLLVNTIDCFWIWFERCFRPLQILY